MNDRDNPADTKPFHRFCARCERWQLTEKFWDRNGRVLRASCAQCRFQAKVRRRQTARARSRQREAVIDQYWSEQAARH